MLCQANEHGTFEQGNNNREIIAVVLCNYVPSRNSFIASHHFISLCTCTYNLYKYVQKDDAAEKTAISHFNQSDLNH